MTSPVKLSEADRALIERLRKVMAISPNTAELLIAAHAQTAALLDAARTEGRAEGSAERERLREIVQDLARRPCETVGSEDLEGGCCPTCRARAALQGHDR